MTPSLPRATQIGSRQVVAVPDGWRLVPVKLPDEMTSIISKFVQGRAIPTSIEGLNSERDEVYFDNGHARELWNKVVSASPLPSSSEAVGWRPLREAKQDGSIIVGRYWHMHEVPNGPYPGYVLMQWDQLEDGGWMDPNGLDYIHEDVVDFRVIEASGEALPSAPVSDGGAE